MKRYLPFLLWWPELTLDSLRADALVGRDHDDMVESRGGAPAGGIRDLGGGVGQADFDRDTEAISFEDDVDPAGAAQDVLLKRCPEAALLAPLLRQALQHLVLSAASAG